MKIVNSSVYECFQFDNWIAAELEFNLFYIYGTIFNYRQKRANPNRFNF